MVLPRGWPLCTSLTALCFDSITSQLISTTNNSWLSKKKSPPSDSIGPPLLHVYGVLSIPELAGRGVARTLLSVPLPADWYQADGQVSTQASQLALVPHKHSRMCSHQTPLWRLRISELHISLQAPLHPQSVRSLKDHTALVCIRTRLCTCNQCTRTRRIELCFEDYEFYILSRARVPSLISESQPESQGLHTASLLQAQWWYQDMLTWTLKVAFPNFTSLRRSIFLNRRDASPVINAEGRSSSTLVSVHMYV